MSRQYAYDVIRGSQVAENLSAMTDNLAPLVKIPPTHERQVRPWAIHEPAPQGEVWEGAVKIAPAGMVMPTLR
jgi:hypothetical protein